MTRLDNPAKSGMMIEGNPYRQRPGTTTTIKYPCRDCTRRHLGCHDKCPDYQAAKAENDAIRDTIQAAKDQQAATDAFKVEAVGRSKKRAGMK